jgi:hypothetical protein
MISRPTREPDVILPAYLTFVKVEVWISECVFKIGRTYHKHITSGNLDLSECEDPLLYLRAVSKYGKEGNPRKKIAHEFLEEIDNILLSIN